MKGILGKKLGMTQIFGDDGAALSVTVVKAGPCVVVQRKTAESDGYSSIQIGLVEDSTPRKVTEPLRGHFKKAGVDPVRRLAEVRVDEDDESKAGDEIEATIFAAGEFVDVVGTGKGKGFQGVMKRHGFGGGRASHGSMFHRAPGSVGQSATPSRVFPGVRLPGQMGAKRITTRGLRVVKVDEEAGLLFLKGSVPGGTNSYILVRESYKKAAAEQ